MGDKARATNVDPLQHSAARPDPAAPQNVDDTVIAPLSELLAYAPSHRGRSSTSQASAVTDDQEDRMPLFLERDEPVANDDGFHFKQQEPVRRDEGGAEC